MATASRGAPKPLSPRDAPAVLARDPMPSVFVLLGDDQEQKDELLDEIQKQLEKRHGVAPEKHRLDCEDDSLAGISATALVGSLFAVSKLVVVHHFDKAPIAARRQFLAEVGGGQMHPSITLVVLSGERSLPSGVDGAGIAAFMFWPLNQAGEILTYIKGRLRKLGVRHSPELASHIHGRFGSQLGFIRQELEKAALAAGTGTLTPELFDQVAVRDPARGLFEVLDLMVQGRGRQAVAGLAELWRQGEPAQKVLPILLGQYQRMLHAAAWRDEEPGRFRDIDRMVTQHATTTNFFAQKGIERDLVSAFQAAMRGSPFEDTLGTLKGMQVLGLAKALKGASFERIRAVYSGLVHLDFQMKTSAMDPELALEMMAARISMARG